MNQTFKKYDLEQRTQDFAKNIRIFVKLVPQNISNKEDTKQVIRSSGSIGANYIEANESLGKKDFIFRLRISRKEAKETKYWLNLIDTRGNTQLDKERINLINEADEILKIMSAIINKSK